DLPVRTSEAAAVSFSGVMKFRVPSWSSSPQRPQLLIFLPSLRQVDTWTSFGAIDSARRTSSCTPHYSLTVCPHSIVSSFQRRATHGAAAENAGRACEGGPWPAVSTCSAGHVRRARG